MAASPARLLLEVLDDRSLRVDLRRQVDDVELQLLPLALRVRVRDLHGPHARLRTEQQCGDVTHNRCEIRGVKVQQTAMLFYTKHGWKILVSKTLRIIFEYGKVNPTENIGTIVDIHNALKLDQCKSALWIHCEIKEVVGQTDIHVRYMYFKYTVYGNH